MSQTVRKQGKINGMKTFAAAAVIAGMTLAAGSALAQNKMELNMATPWAGGHWLDIGATLCGDRRADHRWAHQDQRLPGRRARPGSEGHGDRAEGRRRYGPCLARL